MSLDTSSQHEPTHQLAEDLTPLRLSASRRSLVCPACGGRKGPGKSLCPSCCSSLGQVAELLDLIAIDEGYDHALLHAMRQLGASHLILPRALSEAVIQSIPLQQVDDAVLLISLKGIVCPHCRARKPAGVELCALCRSSLAAIDPRHALLIDPLTPHIRPGPVLDAIATLKGRTFHFPQ